MNINSQFGISQRPPQAQQQPQQKRRNGKKYYMIDLKVKSYAWSTRAKSDDPLHVITRSVDDCEIKNIHCDENIKNALLDIVKTCLPETDWIIATVKIAGTEIAKKSFK